MLAERDARRQTDAARAKADEARQDAERQRDRALHAEAQAQTNLLQARRAVDDYFTLISQSPLLDVPGLQPLRRQLLEAALRYHQEFLLQHPENRLLEADLAASFFRAAHIYHALNANDEAVTTLTSGIELAEKLFDEHPDDHELHRRLAGVFRGNPELHHGTAMPADPEAGHFRTCAVRHNFGIAIIENDPAVPEFRNDLAELHLLIGGMELALGRQHEALLAYQTARDAWKSLCQQHPHVPDYRLILARTEDELGDRVGAIRSIAGSAIGVPARPWSCESRSSLISPINRTTNWSWHVVAARCRESCRHPTARRRRKNICTALTACWKSS